MRHPARLLHVVQQGNVRQNTPVNLQLVYVRSVTHQSGQVTKYSLQCTNSNGWAQLLVHQKSRQCVYPLWREDLFPVWHLHTHTLLATPLVCPNNSGDRILSNQSTIIPLRAWEKHPISSFQNCSGYIFWQTLASDLTLSISPKNFLLFSHLLSQHLSLYLSSL